MAPGNGFHAMVQGDGHKMEVGEMTAIGHLLPLCFYRNQPAEWLLGM